MLGPATCVCKLMDMLLMLVLVKHGSLLDLQQNQNGKRMMACLLVQSW